MELNPAAQPPLAEKKPFEHTLHGDTRVDDYYWLRERGNPEVIEYLESENDYCQQVMANSEGFQKSLFEEIKSRIKEDDSSVPYFYNGYWYITRYETGKEYPIYTRKKDSLDREEEILFDCNVMAQAHDYFHLSGMNVSPDNTKIAFGLDTESRRKYTIYVKDLNSDRLLETKIENTTAYSTWAADNRHLFYTKMNTETLRSEFVFRHDIQNPMETDHLVYQEADETFSVYVGGSKSNEYIFISSYSTLTSEYQYLKSDNPLGKFTIVQERTRGLEYALTQYQGYFYMLTNANQAQNFKIVKAPISSPGNDYWETILEHREDTLLEDLTIFESFWVVTERTKGLNRFRIVSWESGIHYYMPVEGETYTLYTGYNPMFKTTKLRYGFTSLKNPSAVYEFDMETQTRKLLKQTTVLDKNFNPENYIEKRIWAPAPDGEKIPISLIYHKNTQPGVNSPLLQYAYGSYGHTIDPGFSSSRLSLLNRGFIYAIAHIRGGEYMGRQWYENGKLFKKQNTFSDFIACSKHLIKENYTGTDHLYAYGGSAGGMLMGVIANQAPELYKGIVAAVPFVDVVTTMLDESIPLTTSEYDEWGNPNQKDFYEYMKSYSPYDNVQSQHYPNILVTTGLHDSQVQYWEPAKWVAKLRTLKRDTNLLLLDTDMTSGHGGASGRFNAIKETVKKYGFLFYLEGIVN